MTTELPTKLGKEPLIDVVFGVNFDSDTPVDTLLPGLLLLKLAGKQPKFETLPMAQLPQIVRDNDPNLKNAPLMRIVVDEQFTVLIGSKWMGVGCQMPYAGWSAFKEMIVIAFGVLSSVPSVNGVDQYSLKYVDFIETQDDTEPLSRFNLSIEIASRKLSNQTTHLRAEIVEPPFLHAVTIMSPATAIKPNALTIDGVLVDVDTHRIGRFILNEFLTKLPDLLEEIHTANKTFFFDLLSEAGLQELEPQYDL